MRALIPKLRPNWIPIIAVFCFLTGCSSAYYGTMEKLGYWKNDSQVYRLTVSKDWCGTVVTPGCRIRVQYSEP